MVTIRIDFISWGALHDNAKLRGICQPNEPDPDYAGVGIEILLFVPFKGENE